MSTPATPDTSGEETTKPRHFIQKVIDDDIANGVVSKVITRFPPEPNGYLHIGHAMSINLNFGLADEYGGACNLRFDDTNPEKESDEYVQSIIEDVRWMGFQWAGEVKYASDYFDQFYAWAVHLIEQGQAYVCELDAEQTRLYRGTLTEPGKNSPYRDRPAAETLALLEQMKNGEVAEGKMTLRAKIDMASANINLRDPVLYRIKRIPHHRAGDKWNIYPSYDFAHGQEDALEGVTHSICTLEFQDHRPLYEWFLANLPVPSKPRQYEFGRLNINYTITSKRKLKRLVDEGLVDGWDDPRMPTIAAFRRRGVPARALRKFCSDVPVARAGGTVDMAQLESAILHDLNDNAPRAMCVLQPLKVIITNMAQGVTESMTAPAHPNRPDMGERTLPFSREIYIERDDFNEDSTLSRKKFKRLVPGDYVRLRGSYVIRADEAIKDGSGNIVELRCSLVPGTVGEDPPEGIRPRGVIHWVDAASAVDISVNLYQRLFSEAEPEAGGRDFLDAINPDSLSVVTGCKAEPSLALAKVGETYQFERQGYFCLDSKAVGRSPNGFAVFNRTIALNTGF